MKARLCPTNITVPPPNGVHRSGRIEHSAVVYRRGRRAPTFGWEPGTEPPASHRPVRPPGGMAQPRPAQHVDSPAARRQAAAATRRRPRRRSAPRPGPAFECRHANRNGPPMRADGGRPARSGLGRRHLSYPKDNSPSGLRGPAAPTNDGGRVGRRRPGTPRGSARAAVRCWRVRPAARPHLPVEAVAAAG